MATAREKRGTVHDLSAQIANIEQVEQHHPHTKKQIAKYKKLFNEYGLFPRGADNKKKNEIISNLKIVNIDENKLIDNQKILKSLESYNRLIEKERKKLEDEAISGKNMIKNDNILKYKNKIEINIPDKIRSELGIYDKEIYLKRYALEPIKNKIKYYSGQDYNFLIKNGFGRPVIISNKQIQKLRKEGKLIQYVLYKFKEDVEETYARDKQKFSVKEKQKWKSKKKVYDKILNEVLEHNIQIATNKKYNKPFVKRNKKGEISDKDSRIPILMDIFTDVIDLYIP